LETALKEFVERLQGAATTNLVSVVLFGSAASQDFHPEFSDVNLLCVLNSTSVDALRSIAPAVEWWTAKKYSIPLIFGYQELGAAAAAFPIEFIDIKNRHRVLFGPALLQDVNIPVGRHRIQLEHELRSKLLLLRQHYLLASGDQEKVLHLMMKSISSFITLFRHADLALGGKPPDSKRKVVETVAERFRIDPGPFFDLLSVREKHATASSIDIATTFAAYLQSIERVSAAVEAMNMQRDREQFMEKQKQ
jgi:hypothetical protein